MIKGAIEDRYTEIKVSAMGPITEDVVEIRLCKKLSKEAKSKIFNSTRKSR